MKRLKKMQDVLICCVEAQIHENLDKVDTKELGEAIDMIKDLSEAMYYTAITDAMESGVEDGAKEGKGHHGHTMDRTSTPGGEHSLWDGTSWKHRKAYMEGKQTHKDKVKSMQELENYMQELTSDITEMIMDASPEEKQMLQQKISILSTKIK